VTAPPLALVGSLLFPLLAGVALVRAAGVRFRDDRLAFFGWAWLAGTLALTLLLFGWSWFGLPMPGLATSVLLAVTAAGAEWIARRGARGAAPAATSTAAAPAPAPVGPLERVLFVAALAFALLVTLDRVVSANASIICLGDESAIWAAKARVFWFGGGMTEDFRRILFEQRVAHRDYPPMNPLLQWWTWLAAGRMTAFENRFPIQCFAPALILVAAGALRRFLRPGLAAALLLLVVLNQGTAISTWSALSCGIVAFGMLVAADGWLRFDESGRPRDFALFAAGLAAALWAKNEGAMLAALFGGAIAVAACVSKGTRARLAALRGAWAWLVLPLACEAAHRAFNFRYGLTNDLVGTPGEGFLQHLAARMDFASLRTLATWFAESLIVPSTLGDRFAAPESLWFAPSDQNLLLLAALLVAVVDPRGAFRSGRGVVFATLALALAGFAVVYLGTQYDLVWHLDLSVGRVLFDVAPAAAVALASWWGGAAAPRGARAN
jgi:hypothetical protein